jgi:integrase
MGGVSAWTGASDNPSAASAVCAMTCVICAASAHDARGRASCKRQAIGHSSAFWPRLQAVRLPPARLRDDAYLFSNDPAHARPWNPDWVTHRVAEVAAAAGVELDIKGGRHYTASQLLAGGFDLRNTAARLGHSGGGATTLRHYADPVPEVGRRAAAYLAQLTAGPATQSG